MKTWPHDTRLRRRTRAAAAYCLPVALAVALPPLVYALLVRWKFGMLEVSWYVPYEELEMALRGGKLAEVYGAPLWSANMTSGLITANMFTLTVGELGLSVLLGLLIGMNWIAAARLRRACPARTGQAMAVAATSGLASTLAASGTGILGCCGPALSGGMLALAGLSATTAQAIASVSPAMQGALIAVLTLSWAWLRRRAPGSTVPDGIASATTGR
jgi:hypothetical protein